MQLLQNRSFAFLWLSQIISSVADVLYTVGVMVTIFNATGSALQTVGVTIATTLPPFLLGPVAGPMVDRYPRRTVMVLMDGLRAVLVLTLLALFQGGEVAVWLIYTVVAGLAVANTFYLPARQALIPSLVSRHDLIRANSIIFSTIQAAFALGFMVGGTLILLIPLETLLIANGVLFVVAAVFISFIRPHTPPTAEMWSADSPRPRLWESMVDGGRYLRQHPIARPLIVMELLEHIPHGVWTSGLMLVFAVQALGENAAAWGQQNAAYFAAQILGAALTVMFAKWLGRRAGWIIITNAFLSGVLTIAFALSPTNLVAVILAFAFGPPMAIRDITQDSLLQMSVDEGQLGRIFAVRNMFRNVIFMLAGIFFAWLADYLSIRWIYAIGGILYLLTATYALSSRPLRRARMVAQKPASEPAPIPATSD
jgi:MFS transporter, DHA3 family, macrolide efflux protein